LPDGESFEFRTPEGIVRVGGWIRDRRRAQNVDITLADGRVIRVAGYRYGWEVWMEADPNNQASGELTGSIASVLGWWDEKPPDEWPKWVWWLERRLGARDPGRETSAN
jgi:hypothetical protein